MQLPRLWGNRDIEESVTRAPSVKPPSGQDVQRRGYTQGIPIGGATVTNPASVTTGLIDRSDYLNQLLQAYLACPHASAAVDAVARTITAGGVEAVPNSNSNGFDTEIPDKPKQVQEIDQLLAYVNPDEDIRQLFRGVITDLMIYGDSFTEIVWLLGKPVALYTLDPQTMSVQSDPHGTVTGYTQTMPTGLTASFAPHEVVHVKLDQPGSGLYGVSPTNKNILPITTWLFTEALLKETMKKGDPLRAWVDWPMSMSTDEMKRFQQQYAIRNLGSSNIGNLLETKGGAELRELQANQIEKWMALKVQCRDEIFTGYGVPPSKVGVIEAGNLGAGTGTSQDRTFLVNTCGPIGEIVLEKFTFALLQQAYGVYDWHFQFGQVDWRDDMVIEQIADLRIRNGRWTLNKARAVIGLPPVPGGDDAFLVDRQAVVLYQDLGDYSKASVDAISAKANPAQAGGPAPTVAPAKPATVESYEFPGPPNDELEESQWSPSLRGPAEHAQLLEAAWRNHYGQKRAALLQNLTAEQESASV